MLRLRAFLPIAALAGVVLPAAARAQTVSAPYSGYFPDRKPSPIRAQNLNPQGVSYADCTGDMLLTFNLTVSGFDGSQNLVVWASRTSDCTQLADRGTGGQQPVCWALPGGFTGVPHQSSYGISIPLRVQDILAWQSTTPPPTTYRTAGAEACSTQPTAQAQTININFIPTLADGSPTGTAWQYTLKADLVGPQAPSGVSETVGHTLFNVNWTANADSDTAGYDVFIDPRPGYEGQDGGVLTEASTTQSCPDTGSPVTPASDSGDDGSSTDSGDDGSLGVGDDGSATAEAGDGGSDGPVEASTPVDAGCTTVTHGGSPGTSNGYTCNSAVLASGFTQDSGTTTTPITDDAGNVIDDGGTTSGPGGISGIPIAYLAPGNNPTISDKSRGSYQITGLVDGVTYNVAVAAVDAFGNVGPPSQEVCDYPAPVNDFWQQYGADGGKAGGFCSLEAVGAGGTSLAGVATAIGLAGIVRRRRRRSS
jgi:hypothetical protein